MIDETMKIPEPIIEPATSMVESSKPSPLTNFCSAAGVSVIAVVILGRLICAELITTDGHRAMQKNGYSKRKSAYA
jgi:hypothetical protein